MNSKKKKWFSLLAGAGASGPSYSARYQAVLDKATALGTGYEHPTDGVNAILDAKCVLLESAGLFTNRADIFRCHAHDGGAKFGLINWNDPDFALASMPAGDLTHTENVGFTSGNSTKYIDENYTPSTSKINMGADNATVFYYKNGGNSINTGLGHVQTTDQNQLRIQPSRITGSGLAYGILNGKIIISGGAQTDNGANLWALNWKSSVNGQWWKNAAMLADVAYGAGAALPNTALRSAWYGDDIQAFFYVGADIRDLLPTISPILDDCLAELFFLAEDGAAWNFQ